MPASCGLKEFDTSTPEGRSRERYRRVALTAISSAGARVIAVVTMLIAVPLTLHYLGTERYGMWMTISSIIAMMGFADLGMGLGLMNAISEAMDRKTAWRLKGMCPAGFSCCLPWPCLFWSGLPSALSLHPLATGI